MKNYILITTVWITLSTNVFSQKETTWIGGTAGMENNWYCPFNWSTSSVPDEFLDVIIPDVSTTTFSLPTLSSGNVEVNSLNIHISSHLTIRNDATLKMLMDPGALNKEKLKVEGLVYIHTSAGSKKGMQAKANF